VREAQLAALRGAPEVAQSEAAGGWPTCIKCTDATFALGPGWAHWVPVEEHFVEPGVFRLVPIVGGVNRDGVALPGPRTTVVADDLYPPRALKTRGWFVVVARCSHGRGGSFFEEQKAEIDVPYWWGTQHVKAKIASLVFFSGNDKQPELRRLR
jgi:hypothetical protein